MTLSSAERSMGGDVHAGYRNVKALADASVKSIASNDRNQTLGPHPEEAAHRSRACPTSATLKCRNRQQPISMRGRPEALEGRRMAAGTISLVAVLRDARILRQAQERAPQDEADG